MYPDQINKQQKKTTSKPNLPQIFLHLLAVLLASAVEQGVMSAFLIVFWNFIDIKPLGNFISQYIHFLSVCATLFWQHTQKRAAVALPTVLEQKFEIPLAWSLWVIFGPQIGYEP